MELPLLSHRCQEAKALDKGIRQQRDAYVRQLSEARDANTQRLADQLADFELRQERENQDRHTRLQRLAQDHSDQLAEQARQHGLRMAQIDQQVEDEYQRLKEQYDKVFHDLGLQVDGYAARLQVATQEAFKLFDALYGKMATVQGPLAGPLTSFNPYGTSVAPVAVAPNYAVSHTNSRSLNIGTIAPTIVINGTTGLSDDHIKGVVMEGLADALEGYANQ